ncbi:WD40 repeat-like protein [Plenodomus tracheiphilus IPT5]|uniref:WD40 repeat-like protein n=1 Tax=Plenodomus tracheiphilus IPT5 TaxID=1408161 RepID=A0A6A7AXE0_9PLEO|nr:WD40 repeat-like protein [Plenodomus tracheiphilus IPT5]
MARYPHCEAQSGLGVLQGQTKSRFNAAPCHDVDFYPYTLPGVDPVFAVCGDHYTVICRCILQKDSTIEVIRWFEHDHVQASETPYEYNSVAWSRADNGDPLVCVTGGVSQIRVLNVRTGELVQTLIGHGDAINDLTVSPVDPTILASASIDYSVRIWSLHPSHKKQPLAAICYGQGHKDQVLTLAYHRQGRYLLSAGMDTKVNLWTVPDNVTDNAGTDKPAMIHYPHFSTTEVHTDFIDRVQWYNDLILSHAAREDHILLWRIDKFSSDRLETPPPPIPTSAAVNSKTPVTVPADSTSNTRSAWGGRFQRLLKFDLPHCGIYYLRFSLFHEMGRHPMLVAGNERSRAFFWDLQRIEETHVGEDGMQYDVSDALPLSLPRHVRESSTSTASSAVSAGSGTTTKTKRNKIKGLPRDRGLGDPFQPIKAHKSIEVPKYQAFPFYKFAWSRDGQWCVGVGSPSLINVFHRWKDGVPPPTTEESVGVPAREIKPQYNKQRFFDDLTEIRTAYELRKQLADDAGMPFEEIFNETLETFVEGLPPLARDFVRSLEDQ